MDVTTVRVTRDVKQALDRLHGRYLHATGERISQSDLLRRLLSLAEAHEAELLGGDEDAIRFPTRQQLRAFLDDLPDPGVETDASRMDDGLQRTEGPA